jgi:hypothetical protein
MALFCMLATISLGKPGRIERRRLSAAAAPKQMIRAASSISGGVATQ